MEKRHYRGKKDEKHARRKAEGKENEPGTAEKGTPVNSEAAVEHIVRMSLDDIFAKRWSKHTAVLTEQHQSPTTPELNRDKASFLRFPSPSFPGWLSPAWSDFRVVLLYYKCRPCLQYKGRCLGTLDCPGFHSDMDRRRSPAQYNYDSTPCVRVKPSRNSSWKEPSVCPLRDSCTFCHTRAEQQLYPDVYRTVRCRDQLRDGRCPRLRFCAFSHNEEELQELIDFWQAYKRSNQSQLVIFSPSWCSRPPSAQQRQQQQHASPYTVAERTRQQSADGESTLERRGGTGSHSNLGAGPRAHQQPYEHARHGAQAIRPRSDATHDMTSSDESPEPSPTDSDDVVIADGCDDAAHTLVAPGWRRRAVQGPTAVSSQLSLSPVVSQPSLHALHAAVADQGSRLDRLSMAIDRAVASETRREPRIETRLGQSGRAYTGKDRHF